MKHTPTHQAMALKTVLGVSNYRTSESCCGACSTMRKYGSTQRQE